MIKDLRMKHLTFGVRCSPYVATQVIRHLADTHASSNPTASSAILNSLYVDDYLARASSVEEAVQIRTELCDLLNKAGITLRKWRSSNNDFKETIPSDIIETENSRSVRRLELHQKDNRFQSGQSLRCSRVLLSRHNRGENPAPLPMATPAGMGCLTP